MTLPTASAAAASAAFEFGPRAVDRRRHDLGLLLHVQGEFLEAGGEPGEFGGIGRDALADGGLADEPGFAPAARLDLAGQDRVAANLVLEPDQGARDRADLVLPVLPADLDRGRAAGHVGGLPGQRLDRPRQAPVHEGQHRHEHHEANARNARHDEDRQPFRLRAGGRQRALPGRAGDERLPEKFTKLVHAAKTQAPNPATTARNRVWRSARPPPIDSFLMEGSPGSAATMRYGSFINC